VPSASTPATGRTTRRAPRDPWSGHGSAPVTWAVICAFPAKIGSHNETSSLGLTWNSTYRRAGMRKIDSAFVTDDLDARFSQVGALTEALGEVGYLAGDQLSAALFL